MSVDTTHKEYGASVGFWKRCRDVFDGEDAVKAAGEAYLPKLSGQTKAQYTAYKARATFYNATARTVQGLSGMVMSAPPELLVPGGIEDHLKDVTLAGEPAESLVTALIQEVLKVGRHGILLDFSDGAARPYWVPFRAEDIVNWEVVQRKGDATLTLLVLRQMIETRTEFTTVCEPSYRVLELMDRGNGTLECEVRIYKKEKDQVAGDKWVVTETLIPKRKGAPLPFIPFVCFGATGTTMAVDKPPLLDLVNINLSHFRSSADLEHGRHYTALPTPVVTGCSVDGSLKIGSAEAWVLPAPGSDAKYLEFTGTGLGSLKEALTDKEQQMQVLGARLLEPQKIAQEAYGTVRLRQAGDTSVLQTIVASLNIGLTTLWRWHAWWASATNETQDKDVSCGLSTKFNLSPDVDLDNLLLAAQADKISYATYYANLERAGLTRQGVTAEQEREQILSEGGMDPMSKVLPAPAVEKEPGLKGEGATA